jgi:acyl-CoA oxidase
MITAVQADPVDDLRRERARASFDSRELARLLAGGEEALALRERVAARVRADPIMSKRGKYFMERAELYRSTLEKYLHLPKLARSMGEKDPVAAARVVREMIDEPGGLDLHIGMFIPTVQGQGDDEQQKRWLPLCRSLAIIGTYAQTELGHGTFVRGLETTATYDVQTREWIVHSPTLTSTKWWPGGMGKTATHAVVMARLITGGQDRGPHAFIVQIRRNEDHRAMPGVTAGDIGPKMGYNAVDNGFLRFDHVRVPRRAMLMKHARVDPDGTYHPPPVAKAAYGTMVFVRSDIVMNASLYMKKAVTIAIRYNLARRQSNPGGVTSRGERGVPGLELQVLDYQHSQRSLFPVLAMAFAFHCTSDFMRRMYFRFEKTSRGPDADFSALPELHATSSGLKAYCSWATKDAIELCRLCCGGQGFMALAGFGTTFGNYAPNATYEGDNNVLCLQTARFLLKTAREVMKGAKNTPGGKGSAGKPQHLGGGGSASYLRDPVSDPSREKCRLGVGMTSARDFDAMLDAHAHAARRKIFHLAARAGSSDADEATSRDMVAWIDAAKAHCAFVVLQTMVDAARDARRRDDGALSENTADALNRLVALHGLCRMEDRVGDFLEDGFATATQAEAIRAEIAVLLSEIRPDAAALVDALALDDYFLNSALGAWDGDVYRRLFEEVQEAPFNRKHTPPGYEELLRKKLRRGVGNGRSKL